MSVSSIRPALITEVLPDSIGADVGFEPGDAIVSINGTRPRDLIDYQFLCADEFLEIEVIDSQGKTHHIELEKDYDESLGLEFETALFDGLIQCNNRCPFCFIDQQPPGKRGSLYLKDDDYRLSFLYGSYLTLTNLPQSEWDRIAQMRISPLYVSVHATEPEVRSLLLKNKRAGQILEQLKWFQKHRLQIHAQVVVCPGINDGVHLEKTLLDLAEFHRGDIPAVASVAVVPVGLTRFRPPEDQLISVSQEKAREVIKQVQNLQDKFKQELGSTCVWLADEWFLIAREELPPESDYEDYPQIGNGVGSIRKFLREFETAFERVKWETGNGGASPRRWTWVVGNAVELAFKPIVARLNGVEGLRVEMVALASDYWGQEITVTGLLTGQDLIAGLQGRDLGDGVLLPSLMLKTGDTRFLDDLTVAEVEATLQTKIVTVNGVDELLAIASNLTH
ncbi:MAG: TIGR03279 family radical SAM protein [Limnospira sp. PMC 894.15]|uniref:TIGR03279 family radical SAM protein n=1 Tax=Limnospira fusiformis PMC 851.14 TaxID=2219512 RepID=A0ABU9EE50_LIMFS|nr:MULTISPECIES: TIGR03279 family radical SAM protein [unclassified Limnospira]MDT9188449.1 TIGR03279 family radical SAM protein [Limnospira sp. PMC 894.15]MDT9234325.1 TIGR03279 family radical SAM protein [Limnospira sp. PMC 917.15]MDT9275220.1 TIGR03279 family radical SAM protein [Limnospira sp. PMC 737.11]MDY7054945.1 TIGR03279 family radical SAM protein [Limnospira fusiformis LS22]